ncbi:MAG TPA: hypothetical protein VGF99_01570 [Myxococcota bacterium]
MIAALLASLVLATPTTASKTTTTTLVFNQQARGSCAYDEARGAYSCGNLDAVGVAIEATTTNVPAGVTVEAVFVDNAGCLATGVGVYVRAADTGSLVVDGAGVGLIVDGRVVVPTLLQGTKRIAAQPFVLERGTRFDFAVFDESQRTPCWTIDTVVVNVPLVVAGDMQVVTWTASVRPHGNALAVAASRTPEPPPGVDPGPEPNKPAGYSGGEAPVDMMPTVVAGIIGGAAGVGVASVLVFGSEALGVRGVRSEQRIAFGAVSVLALGAAGVFLGTTVVPPTPDPVITAYLTQKATWDSARAVFVAQRRQHEAWSALQARAARGTVGVGVGVDD